MRRLLILALLGCASGGTAASTGSDPRQSERVLLTDEQGRVYRTHNDASNAVEQELPATVAATTQALIRAYEGLGLSVNEMDTNTGRVGVSNFAAPRRIDRKMLSTYMDCGETGTTGPRANSYAVMLNVASRVRPSSTGKVVLSTVATGTARPQGVSGDPLACATTGRLEARINLLVVEQLAAQ